MNSILKVNYKRISGGAEINIPKFLRKKKYLVFSFAFVFILILTLSFFTNLKTFDNQIVCAAEYGDARVECTTTTTKAYPVDDRGVPEVPLYKQGGGESWAGKYYGPGRTIASSGCGPTALSMVLSYYSDRNIYPSETAEACLNYDGCRRLGSGSDATYLGKIAEKYYNMDVSMDIGWNAITNVLERKKLVIITVGPSIFTNNGHFIVLKSKIGNNIYINDSAGDHPVVDVGVVRNAYYAGTSRSIYIRPKEL